MISLKLFTSHVNYHRYTYSLLISLNMLVKNKFRVRYRFPFHQSKDISFCSRSEQTLAPWPSGTLNAVQSSQHPVWPLRNCWSLPSRGENSPFLPINNFFSMFPAWSICFHSARGMCSRQFVVLMQLFMPVL